MAGLREADGWCRVRFWESQYLHRLPFRFLRLGPQRTVAPLDTETIETKVQYSISQTFFRLELTSSTVIGIITRLRKINVTLRETEQSNAVQCTSHLLLLDDHDAVVGFPFDSRSTTFPPKWLLPQNQTIHGESSITDLRKCHASQHRYFRNFGVEGISLAPKLT